MRFSCSPFPALPLRLNKVFLCSQGCTAVGGGNTSPITKLYEFFYIDIAVSATDRCYYDIISKSIVEWNGKRFPLWVELDSDDDDLKPAMWWRLTKPALDSNIRHRRNRHRRNILLLLLRRSPCNFLHHCLCRYVRAAVPVKWWRLTMSALDIFLSNCGMKAISRLVGTFDRQPGSQQLYVILPAHSHTSQFPRHLLVRKGRCSTWWLFPTRAASRITWPQYNSFSDPYPKRDSDLGQRCVLSGLRGLQGLRTFHLNKAHRTNDASSWWQNDCIWRDYVG